MITIVHKKSIGDKPTGVELSLPLIQTTGDLKTFVKAEGAKGNLTKLAVGQMCWAIAKIDALVGHGGLDLEVDAEGLFGKLDGISPAMAGLEKQSYANLKYRLRKALQLARPNLTTARSTSRLVGPWRDLYERLTERQKRSLSRFIHAAQECGWAIECICDQHVERFDEQLRASAIVKRKDVLRATIGTWNKLAETGLVVGPLTPPAPKRTAYWLRFEQLPIGLGEEVRRFLQQLAEPMGLLGKKKRKPSPSTVANYRYDIITLISAIVGSGTELQSLASLKQVVTAANLHRALVFLHERRGEATHGMLTMASRVTRLARWCGAPPQELDDLDRLQAALREEVEPHHGMTRKNLEVVGKLDEARFRNLLVLLPTRLMRQARMTPNQCVAASRARAAAAIEILLMCALRRENLVGLELDKTIRKQGEGNSSYWVIELGEEAVKNGEPLRHLLSGESAEIIEDYLKNWRPLLCDKPSPHFFPSGDGERMDGKQLSESIAVYAERELGLRITAHQFRHISAELYLRAHADGMSMVSYHLGHRDLNTARRYYAKPKQREASRSYQESLLVHRQEAKVSRTRRYVRRGEDQL